MTDESDSKTLHARALAARRSAAMAGDPELAAIHLEMARRFEQLAKAADGGEEPSSA